MFVRDFAHVERPYPLVASRFGPDASWLAPLAQDAVGSAGALIGAPLGTARPPEDSREADLLRCAVGLVRRGHRGLVVRVHLADGGHRLPELDGDLEIRPVGTARTLLAFSATYPRPAADRATVERVERTTEAGVRSFLVRVADVVAAPAMGGSRR